jgi:hypothetical protein
LVGVTVKLAALTVEVSIFKVLAVVLAEELVEKMAGKSEVAKALNAGAPAVANRAKVVFVAALIVEEACPPPPMTTALLVRDAADVTQVAQPRADPEKARGAVIPKKEGAPVDPVELPKIVPAVALDSENVSAGVVVPVATDVVNSGERFPAVKDVTVPEPVGVPQNRDEPV